MASRGVIVDHVAEKADNLRAKANHQQRQQQKRRKRPREDGGAENG